MGSTQSYLPQFLTAAVTSSESERELPPLPTELLYQLAPSLRSHVTKVLSISSLQELPEAELFKKYLDHSTPVYCLVTEETIFYPQSGGQPSDIGTITSISKPRAIFNVLHAKALPSRCVIHLGTFTSPEALSMFIVGEAIRQDIDETTRYINSKYHTAGHIIYDAVLALNDILQIEEGVSKAHFFPTGSYVEFNGLIENAHRGAIQAKIEELVAKRSKILTYMWDAKNSEKTPLGLDRIGPEVSEDDVRVTAIKGGNPWACCGTHVEDTGAVGGIVLSKKFRRSNGKTSIGYKVI